MVDSDFGIDKITFSLAKITFAKNKYCISQSKKRDFRKIRNNPKLIFEAGGCGKVINGLTYFI